MRARRALWDRDVLRGWHGTRPARSQTRALGLRLAQCVTSNYWRMAHESDPSLSATGRRLSTLRKLDRVQRREVGQSRLDHSGAPSSNELSPDHDPRNKQFGDEIAQPEGRGFRHTYLADGY